MINKGTTTDIAKGVWEFGKMFGISFRVQRERLLIVCKKWKKGIGSRLGAGMRTLVRLVRDRVVVGYVSFFKFIYRVVF